MYSGPPMPWRSWLKPRPTGPWKPARALAISERSGAFGSFEGAKWSDGVAGRVSPVAASVTSCIAAKARICSSLIAGPPCSASSR